MADDSESIVESLVNAPTAFVVGAGNGETLGFLPEVKGQIMSWFNGKSAEENTRYYRGQLQKLKTGPHAQAEKAGEYVGEALDALTAARFVLPRVWSAGRWVLPRLAAAVGLGGLGVYAWDRVVNKQSPEEAGNNALNTTTGAVKGAASTVYNEGKGALTGITNGGTGSTFTATASDLGDKKTPVETLLNSEIISANKFSDNSQKAAITALKSDGLPLAVLTNFANNVAHIKTADITKVPEADQPAHLATGITIAAHEAVADLDPDKAKAAYTQLASAMDAFKNSPQAAADKNIGMPFWAAAAMLREMADHPDTPADKIPDLVAGKMDAVKDDYTKWAAANPKGSDSATPEEEKPPKISWQDSQNQWYDQKVGDQIANLGVGQTLIVTGRSAYTQDRVALKIIRNRNNSGDPYMDYTVEGGAVDKEGNIKNSGGFNGLTSAHNIEYAFTRSGSGSLNVNSYDALESSIRSGSPLDPTEDLSVKMGSISPLLRPKEWGGPPAPAFMAMSPPPRYYQQGGYYPANYYAQPYPQSPGEALGSLAAGLVMAPITIPVGVAKGLYAAGSGFGKGFSQGLNDNWKTTFSGASNYLPPAPNGPANYRVALATPPNSTAPAPSTQKPATYNFSAGG